MDAPPPAAVVSPGFPPMVPAGGRLREVAEQFESVFLATVISRMFDGLPTDGPFGGGHAEATYRSFLADEYAGALAGRGGIGIADVVYADLLRIQEAEAP